MATPAATLAILVTANTKQANAALAKTNAQLGATTKTATASSVAMKRLGTAAKFGGLFLAGGLAVGLKKSVDEAREANKVMAQTNAVIKSTGGAAKVTAKEVEALSERLSEKAGVDDEAIQSGANLLLTFKNIRNEAGKGNDVFDRTTSLALDMSAALGQDMKSSAIQLGKALNDPSVGLTALRRVGVSFTAQQSEQILKMQESGDLMKAQKTILAELSDEFRGSAKAQADAGDRLRVVFDNIAEDVGMKVVPALEKMANRVSNILSNKKLSGEQKAERLADYFTRLVSKGLDALTKALPKIAEMGGKLGLKLAESFGKAFVEADIWGKLFLTAAFFRMVGGKAVFGTIGRKAGELFGKKMGPGIAAGLVLFGPTILEEAFDLGKKAGEAVKNAFGIGSGSIKEGFGSKFLGKGFTQLHEAPFLRRNEKERAKLIEKARKESHKHQQRLEVSNALAIDDILGEGFVKNAGTTRKGLNKQEGAFESTRKKLGRTTEKQTQEVGGNTNDLVGAVGRGLKILGSNTNNALGAFGAKKLHFAVNNPQNLAGRQRGGPINEGAPSGDSVPAMLEKGEYVLNRKAVAAMGKSQLDAINFGAAKRFATGGMVDPAGPGTGVVNSAIAKVVGAWSKRYNAAINYGYDPGGGHQSPGHNVTGTATDTGPAAGWGSGPTKLFETGLRAISGKVDQILYGSHGVGTPYPDHGYGNHAHIEWGMHPTIQGIAGTAIKRLLLKGPNGPLKDMGQASLDKSRKAANRYIQKMVGMSGGADIGPQGPGGIFTKSQLKKLWKQVNGGLGSPNTMAAVALAESSGDPNAVGNDPGGTQGLGLWQITTGFNDDLIKKYGGYNAMFNPVNNAKAAADILQRQGLGAWYAPWQQYLQKGGAAGSGMAPPFKGIRKLARSVPRLRDRLKKITRKIGKTDERLSIAQQLASLESSPGGSGLSGAEKTQQLGLLDTLEGQLLKQQRISQEGLKLSKRFGFSPSAFRDSLLEVQGLTGKGGRLFDTMLAKKELQGTSLAGSLGISIDDLLRIRDASQIGLLNNLPTFHGGGVVPGPVGSPQPIMAQGGETVNPVGGTQYFDIYIGGEKIAEHVRAELRQADRSTELRRRQGALR